MTNNILKTTLTLKEVNGITIPIQNDIVYPSFEPQKRRTVNLNGIWTKLRFHDMAKRSMAERNQDWIKEALNTEIIKSDFDCGNLETIMIPGIENKATGEESTLGMEQYQDGVWYRRKFDLIKAEGKRYLLKCLGLSYVGDIFINERYVGYHEGGYTPFAFDITDFLNSGNNVIVVRVDNPKWGSRFDIIPATEGTDFFNYTGILQDIYIEELSEIYLPRVDIVPLDTDGNCKVRVAIVNNANKQRKVTMKLRVYDTDKFSRPFLESIYPLDLANNEVDIEIDGLDEITVNSHEFTASELFMKIKNPKLWSVNDPNLYILQVSIFEDEILYDEFATQFGLRTVKTKGCHILLNGQSIFLSGIARHEEWPIYGRSANWERIKADFMQIKSLNVNYVRTAHYPNHVYTYMFLDRIGLLSTVEIPLWQFETKHYEVIEDKGLSYQMFREMVYSNFNRPSIIMWSTQNESKDVKLRKLYNEKLVNEVRHKYQDLRLVTQSAAADQPGYYDESMEVLDVLGWTMYFGIFHGSTPYEGTRRFIEKAHLMWPNKPIINTEYGVWSFEDDSQMEYQYKVYNDVLLALTEKSTVTPLGEENKLGYIAGINYWTAYNWYVNHNHFIQTMGLCHMDRKTKKLITDRFIEDQRYLLGNTYGLSDKVLTNHDLILFNGEHHLSKAEDALIIENISISENYPYLVIEVFAPLVDSPISVTFVSLDKEVVYESYKITMEEAFCINILLYKVDINLANLTKIIVKNQFERQLNIKLAKLTNQPIC